MDHRVYEFFKNFLG